MYALIQCHILGSDYLSFSGQKTTVAQGYWYLPEFCFCSPFMLISVFSRETCYKRRIFRIRYMDLSVTSYLPRQHIIDL